MALRNLFTQITNRTNSVQVLCLPRSFSVNMADKLKVIEYENLKDKVLGGEIVLIDVREPAELKDDGKIPNSVNIPLGQIADAFKMPETDFKSKYGIPKPDAEAESFVLSCRSGKRATDAFQKLSSLGYNNMSVYSGSFQDWVKNGGPVEK
ncbi:hypothetical protein TNIN_205251 [Trichonephila inaurata madagascariensis]|uniref:Rhodanese domain-containing protein n=1 Tax=Trichonephila inaurata madagascariensis TaxID=2747483 RepID=A0A8X7C4Q2_9ARAC|nr:hypothetical protein TNIN_205251 [Trichonephila inaurata madagascariensis]